jgi:hypothetical protein
VNVQVASWSATATALPAESAVWKTTCGQSKVAPLMQAGMSRMTRSCTSPAESSVRFLGSRPIPTGRSANGERLPKSRWSAGWTSLTGTPGTSCLPSVKRIIAGRTESAGRCLTVSSIAAT